MSANLRDEFLLDPGVVFLNHGSFGACPRKVLAAQQDWQREMERNPVEFLARRSADLLAEARRVLGAFLGANSGHLSFVPNATHAVNTVARSLRFAVGDEVVATDHEYGACDNTWDFVAARTGARVVRAEIPLPFHSSEFTERVWERVTPRTKLIFLSHITSTTALLFPISEVCARARKAGILTLIDGAHAPGQVDLDLDALGADFYTGNCHKWLCAPKGSAFLHARPEHHPLLDSPVVSWGYSEGTGGHTGFEAFTGSTLLERRLQWQGTRDLSAFLSVPAALGFLSDVHWRDRRREAHALAVQAMEACAARFGGERLAGPEDFVQMAPIQVPPCDPELLRRTLFERHRIEVPVTTHKGRVFVRMSAAIYTTAAEVEALLRALEGLTPTP